MTKIKDILNYFESFAPVYSAMEFDNVGLLVGDSEKAVSRVLISLDITREVVLEAEKLGCELIISHHPVIFSPIKRLKSDSVPYLLAKTGIFAICMHTNLDLCETFGVNICLAQAIGVKNPIKSEAGECLFVGELENHTDIDSFALSVKSALGCKGLRYTAVNKSIKRVAVSSGSGGSEIFAAAQISADVLVTGEIKHHEINAANELDVSVIDVGHFKSEDVVILPLINRLSEKFPEITFTKSEEYSDNINYI